MSSYEEIKKQKDSSVGQLVLKQAGTMAAYMALNTAFGAAAKIAGSFAAKTLSSAIKAGAESQYAKPWIQKASNYLVNNVKSAPKLTDIARSIGIKIPQVSDAFKPVANWAKEQITTLPSMMIVQNISALSDGRKLSAVDLLKESVQADLVFRAGIGGLNVLRKGAVSSQAYKSLAKTSWKPVEKALTTLDLNISYFASQLKKADNSFTYNPSKSFGNFNEINSKYGVGKIYRTITNTAAAAMDTLSTSMEGKITSKLTDYGLDRKIVSIGGNVSKDIENVVKKSLQRDVVSRYSKYETGLTASGFKNKNYESLESSATTVVGAAMKMFQFEGVPVINLLQGNHLLKSGPDLHEKAYVVGGGKGQRMLLPVKGKVAGDTMEDMLDNILGSSKKALQSTEKTQNRSTYELFLAAQKESDLSKGLVHIPDGFFGVSSGSGVFIGTQMSSSVNPTLFQVASKQMITGSVEDAEQFLVANVIQSGSQAGRMRGLHSTGTVSSGNREGIGIGNLRIKDKSLEEVVLNTKNNELVGDIIKPENVNSLTVLTDSHSSRYNAGGGGLKDAIEGSKYFKAEKNYLSEETTNAILAFVNNPEEATYEFFGSKLFGRLNDSEKKIIQTISTRMNDSIEINSVRASNKDLALGILYNSELRSGLDFSQAKTLLNSGDDKLISHVIGLGFHERMSDNTLAADIIKKVKIDKNLKSYDLLPVKFTAPQGGHFNPDALPASLKTAIDVQELAKDTRTSSKMIQTFKDKYGYFSDVDVAIEKSTIENSMTMNLAAVGVSSKDKLTAITVENMGEDAFANVYTIATAAEQSSILSVNDLAKSFGAGIDLNGSETLGSYMSGLLSNNWTGIAGLGVGLIATDMVLKSGAFKGSPLEDGLIPFASGAYGTMKMFGATIANVSGLSMVAKTIDNAVPGLISSPLGGALLTAAPLIAGAYSGMQSGSYLSLMKSTALGVLGSAVLGGLGGSILGDYDVSMGLDEAYGITSGNEAVGVRKGRFWGLSAGSFWGQNVQYYRNSMTVNGVIGPTATYDIDGDSGVQLAEQIGLLNPVSRNKYSRPYLNIGNSSYGAAVHGDTAYLGQGAGSNSASLLNDATNLYGLRGFLYRDALLKQLNPELTETSHVPKIASAKNAYGINRRFQNLNAGGFFGQTEFIRRILPKHNSSNDINPLRNLMPDWLPGEDYFINFKEGDPYSKISEGEIRLPGSGHLASNPVNLELVYDLELMGMLSDEDTINNAVYGNLMNQEENINGQTIRRQHLDSVKQSAQAQGFRINESPTYYAGNNIIADADYEIQGTAVKLETVSSSKFMEAGKEGGQNVYQRKADLLSSISNKQSEVVVIDSTTGQQKTFTGKSNPGMLRDEISRLRKLQPKILKKMKAEGKGINNLYSIVDRFKVLADIAPYSKEYRNYEKIIKRMASNGELNDDQIKQTAKAIKKREVVVRGLSTADGKGSPLHSLLPSKLLAPEQIDPLIAYREQQVYSSGMKRWEQPLDYFKDDFALSASGKFNPIKRGISSAFLYNFVFGAPGAVAGGLGSATTALAANITGGIEMRDTYDRSRQILLQQSALDYARNIESGNSSANTYNLYGSMINGNVDPDRLMNSVSRTDRTYLEAFKNVTDENYRNEVMSTLSPDLAHIIGAKYGGDYNIDSSSLDQATSYINSIDKDSILFDTGVNTDYLVIRELEKYGIDPRNVGKNFDQEKYEMSKSYYNELDLSSQNIQSVEQEVTKALKRVVKGRVMVTDFNVPGERNINVVIVNG